MSFDEGILDYHPGLGDPWLLLSYVLIVAVAASVTMIANRSRPKLVMASVVLVASSPFVLGALLHGVYFVVNPRTERILCTHWVRGGLLPELAAVIGIAAGSLFVRRGRPGARHT